MSLPIWERIKQHKVVQWALAYAAIGFALLQGLDVVAHALGWPAVALRIATLVLLLGWPLVVVLAWYHGHKGQQRFSTVEISILTVLVLVAGGVLWFFGASPASKSASSAFAPPPHSIAVMPFVNMSGDAKNEYFSDGLSEELLHALTRINELHVAARTSSFSFKGTAVDIPTIARRLNVGTVLEGSVRKAGDRVRITTQLIDAISGYHVWSQTFDRELDDILALQTEIATSVARALKITLLGEAQQKLVVGGTANPFAFDAYLRGRQGESIQDQANLRAALAALDEAVTLDPNYALAHAFRADVLAQLAGMWAQDAKERERLSADARAAAMIGVALAPESGRVYSALAGVLASTTVDYKATDAAYRRSIALEPGNAELLNAYASYAASFGRPDALIAAKKAVTLNPLSAGANANLGVVLYYARDYEQARAAFRKTAAIRDNLLNVNWTGVNELASGHPAAALPYSERDPAFWYNQFCLALAYHALDRKEEAAAMLQKIKDGQGDGAAYQYAEIYAYWGDRDRALEWLTRAVELQDGGLLSIKVDPFLDSIRGTPQFESIVRELDLPS